MKYTIILLSLLFVSCQKKHCWQCVIGYANAGKPVIDTVIYCDATQKQIENAGYALIAPCKQVD